MNTTFESPSGQPGDPFRAREVVMLCELMQYIRAWWDAFQSTIKQLDRVASAKAYDAIVEAVALARLIARSMGVTLTDFSNEDWSASVPAAGRCSGEDL